MNTHYTRQIEMNIIKPGFGFARVRIKGLQLQIDQGGLGCDFIQIDQYQG